MDSKVEYPGWVTQSEEILGSVQKINKNEHKILQNFEKNTQNLFEPVGISFGSDQTYKINEMIKLISERENATSIRFWGKIMGKHSDYFVIQGICKKKK